MMTSKLMIALPVFALTFAAAPMVFAQADTSTTTTTTTSPSASSDVKSAGSSVENAASEAYHGTARALKDTAITAKVDTALHDDRLTDGVNIHVDTIAGVVTLSGTAPSAASAKRAMQLARQTTGVRGVKDAITIGSQNSSAH